MKVALIIIGQAFRNGDYEGQIKAMQTHKRFINSDNFSVFLNVETSKYDNEIKDFYKPELVNSIFRERVNVKNLEDLSIGRKKQLDEILKTFDKNDYDQVFILRIDVNLRDLFFQNFNFSDKVIFPFITKSDFTGNKTPKGLPRTCDMFMSIPKKHYKILDYENPIFHEHSMDDINLPNSEIEVVIETMHDSDSGKRWNPLYFITNRNVSDIKEYFENVNDYFPDIKITSEARCIFLFFTLLCLIKLIVSIELWRHFKR